ncbi:MAG: flavodoxin family protein [Gemmiger sp.]|nr:flavodoxin family protein [Gemmiger sp.]
MTYAIVYSSQTGNTAQLAGALKAALPASSLVYCGAPDAAAPQADFVFAGFWTDRGNSDPAATEFLKTLRGKQVFLFGTAGFGGSDAYFAQILQQVETALDPSNTVVGRYMCQGKMPASVRQRYQAMQAQQPEKMQEMIENFDRALAHPDEADLANFVQAATPFAAQ